MQLFPRLVAAKHRCGFSGQVVRSGIDALVENLGAGGEKTELFVGTLSGGTSSKISISGLSSQPCDLAPSRNSCSVSARLR